MKERVIVMARRASRGRMMLKLRWSSVEPAVWAHELEQDEDGSATSDHVAQVDDGSDGYAAREAEGFIARGELAGFMVESDTLSEA